MQDAPPDFVRIYRDGVLQISTLGQRAMRVRFAPPGSPQGMPQSQILIPGAAHTEAAIVRQAGITRLGLPHLICEVETANGRLRFLDGNGRELLAESAGGRRLLADWLRDEPIHVAEQSFESPAGEHLYGTGCFQDGAFDLRSLPRRLTQVNTQISLPFLLSSRGYGLLWHHFGRSDLNTPPHRLELHMRSSGPTQVASVSTSSGGAEQHWRLASFVGAFVVEKGGRQAFLLDIGQKMGKRYRVAIDGRLYVDHTNFWLPPTTSFLADLAPGTHRVEVEATDADVPVLYFGPAQDRTVWRSPVAGAIDYVVIAGPAARDILYEVRDLLGPTPMLPRWAFGYVHSRERFHSSQEIVATLDEFRRRRLPVDVMVQDWEYWGKHGWNAMRFDEAHYPDPAGLVAEVHRRGARLMLSVWPRIDPCSELGQEFTRRGFYIPGSTWVDFFNPEAVAFYCARQEAGLGCLGIDGWWQDANEPENDDLVGRTTAAGKGEHLQLVYPLEVTRAVHDGRRAAVPDQRPMILTRSAFLGQQRYGAVTWSGDIGNDFATLKRQIPAGLNMAATGYSYWTVDAGGFFRPGPGQYTDPAYRERLVRWVQYATFLPMQRVHGFESDTELWRYGDEVEAISRAYLELRYRLLPYVYSAAAETVRSGLPMMRPLAFDFAGDERALSEAHAYMFGDALHVAPVYAAGVESWPVYLPRSEGGWFDFWTGAHRQGGHTHDVPCPIERIPLHVRAGSLVPVGPVLQSTVEATNAQLDLVVFAGRDGAFCLYEDDGLTNAYETGGLARIPMRWDDRRGELLIGAREGPFADARSARRLHVYRVAPGVPPLGSGPGTVLEYAGKPVRLDLSR